MESIAALSKKLEDYLNPAEVKQVNKAYDFACEAHSGQYRSSGDPYVSHPVAVASILSTLRMDEDSLSAAMLHDVMEDTGIPKTVIEKKFNKNVANLVDGVSKLDKLSIVKGTETEAENLQKMVLAMSKDIRVIVVKLADRLHNMRTLMYVDREKQLRIAKETLEIYAPIAHRIGMNSLYRELEDLAFKTVYPTRYERLKAAVKKNRGGQKRVLNKIQKDISSRLLKGGIAAIVEGREKHIYSIYRKMKERRRSFEEIMDVYAIKIVVDSAENCYRSLGHIHSLYKPVEGRFKDYIAIPKSNGYQSIHTGVIGLKGIPVEIQIKTQEMNDMAENGIASHWLYKSGDRSDSSPQIKARRWVAGLLEMRESYETTEEFIESVKTDIFPDEIYVFTPQGEIIEMSAGSTAIDFAYAVHTDIGHHCRACRINKKLAPLSVPLESGQTVEILREKVPQTSPAWLNFATTPRARSSIRHYLSNLKTSEARKFGKKLLDQSLASLNIKLRDIDKDDLRGALDSIGGRSLNRILKEIGLGLRVANIVAQQIAGFVNQDSELRSNSAVPLEITGSEGLIVNYATCCKPIPGDSVIGHFTADKGLVVHQERCKNILSFREDPQQCFPINWGERSGRVFTAQIKIVANDEPGLLANIASAITDEETNICSIQTTELNPGTHDFVLDLEVSDRLHLSKIIRKIKNLKSVVSISRIHDQEMRQAKVLH
ncbi:MAG TPA: bifunctional (p)ppGpp synthetase/guanosine-3',5'-bis(diphosphate) 3'-pyrophosphohydrolase [SAR86 cluster bacterium]|nr:bifunctional (p)ppGpp synthetase/guanosine-3',5'-bis(diphosphate) 3'-pyrophosphohydrolase [SAR86 cluster bacterium]